MIMIIIIMFRTNYEAMQMYSNLSMWYIFSAKEVILWIGSDVSFFSPI